jgi:hypothetical protein
MPGGARRRRRKRRRQGNLLHLSRIVQLLRNEVAPRPVAGLPRRVEAPRRA